MGVVISTGWNNGGTSRKNSIVMQIQRKKSKQIDVELWKDKEINESIMKLLLLGKFACWNNIFISCLC